LIISKDDIIQDVYDAVYTDVKHQNEREINELKDIHSQFDYIYDKEKMEDKNETRWYNPEDLDAQGEL
jgi:hypothetical protein